MVLGTSFTISHYIENPPALQWQGGFFYPVFSTIFKKKQGSIQTLKKPRNQHEHWANSHFFLAGSEFGTPRGGGRSKPRPGNISILQDRP